MQLAVQLNASHVSVTAVENGEQFESREAVDTVAWTSNISPIIALNIHFTARLCNTTIL